MRFVLAIAAAALVAGFTVKDAEKALDGVWQSPVDPIHVRFDSARKTVAWTEAGTSRTDPFEITSTEPGLVRFTIAGRPTLAHLQGRTVTIAAEGDAKGRYLSRPR